MYLDEKRAARKETTIETLKSIRSKPGEKPAAKGQSVQKLLRALNHQDVGGVCLDMGGTLATGVSVGALSRFRQELTGDKDYRVKVIDSFQMLGEVDQVLVDMLGVDVLGMEPAGSFFGIKNENWKPFKLFDGTEVLVPGDFNVSVTPKGGWYVYPQGDTSVPPSGHMPKGGVYFDGICRQEPIDEDKLDPKDNLEEFGPLTDAQIQHQINEAKRLSQMGKGVVFSVPGAGFGDVALVPAPWMKKVKGIRDIQEWYMSTAMRPDYVYEVFEGQCEIALKNLEKLIPPLKDDVHVAFTTGTDFGMQTGLFISPKTYKELFKPFHKTINDYIHKNTNWKIFMHCCGSIFELIPEFIDAGFDILNPVQCSAANMDPRELKREFGKDIVFWGGGIDTQTTLTFGTPQEVYDQTRRRIEIFNESGGFVFATVHNIQANTPVENIKQMLKAVQDSQH